MVCPWTVKAHVRRSDETNVQTRQKGYLPWTFLDEPLVESLGPDPRLLVSIRARSIRIRPWLRGDDFFYR